MTDLEREQLENWFTYHSPTPYQLPKYHRLRGGRGGDLCCRNHRGSPKIGRPDGGAPEGSGSTNDRQCRDSVRR